MGSPPPKAQPASKSKAIAKSSSKPAKVQDPDERMASPEGEDIVPSKGKDKAQSKVQKPSAVPISKIPSYGASREAGGKLGGKSSKINAADLEARYPSDEDEPINMKCILVFQFHSPSVFHMP
jgi:hypothetical protein